MRTCRRPLSRVLAAVLLAAAAAAPAAAQSAQSTRETLIEQVVAAFRERVRGEIRFAPAWHDLDETGRIEAFDEVLSVRVLEAA